MMKNFFKKNKKDSKIQCLFQLNIHSLEEIDYVYQHHDSKFGSSLADCLIDLLQHKYSIVWRTRKKKGVTKVATIKSKFDDSVEERSSMNEEDSQKRKSISNLKKMSILRNSRKLVYSVDFNFTIDFVASMKLDTEKGSRLSPMVKDCLIYFDIQEHFNNETNVVATITANLADFTTPPSTMGTMKKTVLFPIEMSSHKVAKLRVSVSSIWLNTQAPSLEALLENKRSRHSTYFVVEEDKEIPLPMNVNLTPRSYQSPRVGSPGGTNSPVSSPQIPKLELNRTNQLGCDDSKDSPKAQTAFTPRTEAKLAFANEASNYVSRLKKLKADIAKLEKEKSEIFKKLELSKSTAAPTLYELNKTIDQFKAECEELKINYKEIMKRVNEIHDKLEVFENEKMGTPKLNHDPINDTITAVYCDLQGAGKLWELPKADMERCVQIYVECVRKCILQSGGYEMPTDSDAILCIFGSAKRAISFCLQTQLQLMEEPWPESLMMLEGMNIKYEDRQIYRGLRVRMGLDCGKAKYIKDEKTGRYIYFSDCIQKAMKIASYALGGQILLSDACWKELYKSTEQNPKPIRTIVQDLGDQKLEGLEYIERIRLIIPESLRGRQFEDSANLKLILQDSWLISELYNQMDDLRKLGLDNFVAILHQLEEKILQLNTLIHLFQDLVAAEERKENLDPKEVLLKEVLSNDINSDDKSEESPSDNPEKEETTGDQKEEPKVESLEIPKVKLSSPKTPETPQTPNTPKNNYSFEKVFKLLQEKQNDLFREIGNAKTNEDGLLKRLLDVEETCRKLCDALLEHQKQSVLLRKVTDERILRMKIQEQRTEIELLKQENEKLKKENEMYAKEVSLWKTQALSPRNDKVIPSPRTMETLPVKREHQAIHERTASLKKSIEVLMNQNNSLLQRLEELKNKNKL